MSWNLRTHILDHSHSIVNNLSSSFDEQNSKNQHFTLSIDIAQLIINKECRTQKNIDNVMNGFMNDLVQHEHVFEESKGRSKTGGQLRRKIKFNFNDALIAYHNSGSDTINSSNYNVEPHLHILFDKKKKLGIGYHQLRQAIEAISKKHELVFNFQEEVNNNNNSLKQQATNFTWFIKRSSNKVFQKKVSESQFVNQVNDFIQHCKNSNNLQYYIKGMKDFQARLKRLNIDYIHDEENIKNRFSLHLTQVQLETLKMLHQGNRKDIKKILEDRDNKLGRSFIEYQYGFKNVVMGELIHRGFSPLQYSLDDEKLELKLHKKRSTEKGYDKTLDYCYKLDLQQVLELAKNEKELQLMMQQLGYKEFSYKQKTIASKRSRVGFTFINKHKKKTTVYYSNLHLSAKDIRSKLIENKKEHRNAPKQLYSYLDAYIPLNTKSKTNIEFEKIYEFDTSFDLTNWYIKEFDSYVLLQDQKTKIVDQENKIAVHKYSHKDLATNAKLLVDMAIAKGWDTNKLKITGRADFIKSIENELLSRSSNDSEESMVENQSNIDNKSVRSSHDLLL